MAGIPVAAGRSEGASPARVIALLAALGFALSPVLVDLARHFAEVGWTRYALPFTPLLVWQIARHPPCDPSPHLGWALVAIALLVEVVAVGGGVPRFGRPALCLAVFGACRALGMAPATTLALAAWAIPIPSGLLSGLGLPLLHAFGHAAGGVLGSLAVEPDASTVRFLAPNGSSLVLGTTHAGVTLAAFLSGVGWLAGLRAGSGPLGCILRALTFGLAAPILQLAIVVAAAFILHTGRSEAAKLLLDTGPWLLSGAIGILFVARSGRRPT